MSAKGLGACLKISVKMPGTYNSGILCKFVCLLLEGPACLLDTLSLLF